MITLLTGLSYSEAEPSALIQTSGGPCAVIAPLQAYIIKNLIFTPAISSNSAQAETTTETNFNELTGTSYHILFWLCCVLFLYTLQGLYFTALGNFDTNDLRSCNSCLKTANLYSVFKFTACYLIDVDQVLYYYHISVSLPLFINIYLLAEEVARCMGRAVTDILGGVSAKAKCILVTYTGNAIDQSQGPSTSSEDGESNNKRPKLFSFDSFHELLK